MTTGVSIVAGVAVGGAVLGAGYLGYRWYRRRQALRLLSSPQARQIALNLLERQGSGPRYV